MTAPTFTAAEKRAEVQRELQIRRKLFPGWVSSGRITQEVADRRIAILEEIARDYQANDLFERVG